MSILSTDAQIAVTHVERHPVAQMIQSKLKEAVLHINYKTGPCQYCRAGIQELLGEGQRLWVVFPRGIGFFTKDGWVKV